MLATLAPGFRTSHLARLMGVVLFAAFTALAARVTIPLPFTPVPITLQVLAVLLAGLVLGPSAGAASQLVYLMVLATGLPLDAKGLGPVALTGPTAGYLIGFVPAAFATGWMAKQLPATRVSCFLGAVVGVAVIYAAGIFWLAQAIGSLRTAWMLGVAPFLLIDLGKAIVAAVVAEGGQLLLKR
jgi:biotin transport system substrate-specific component